MLSLEPQICMLCSDARISDRAAVEPETPRRLLGGKHTRATCSNARLRFSLEPVLR